ncbi:hypothetical protein PUN28_001939 [Cardiocondyla obscurior]|uniref:Uncharacterized protein n=1 Tax=Cardiocondyla obscurior TaxID=286306 RepID=A0AAW2GRU9_9HYME
MPRGPWRGRRECSGGVCFEGGGCTPMGPATKSKISVTLSSPLGCEQGSHMWFSPCFGERHGSNFKMRDSIRLGIDSHWGFE